MTEVKKKEVDGRTIPLAKGTILGVELSMTETNWMMSHACEKKQRVNIQWCVCVCATSEAQQEDENRSVGTFEFLQVHEK